MFEDHATAKPHAPRRAFVLVSIQRDSLAYPARFIPPSVKRGSHTPLEIANICGSISNR